MLSSAELYIVCFIFIIMFSIKLNLDEQYSKLLKSPKNQDIESDYVILINALRMENRILKDMMQKRNDVCVKKLEKNDT